MNTETRGTLSRRGNISQITNAFVEEVNAFSNTSTGYIIVSYAASPGQQSDNIQMLRLNINRNTVILDSSGRHIPVGNPSANMDQCRFLFCNDTEHPSTGKCISDHGTEAAPSNWNCNIDRQDCKYRRRKWLFVHRQSKRHQQPGPLRRLKFHLLRSIRPPDHTFIPPPQPARPHYTCNHTDRKHPTSDNSVSCAVIVTESLLWLHNFFKYLPQFHHELRLL